MSDTDFDPQVISRIPPGSFAEIDAHQGWALECHRAEPAQARPFDLLFVHGMSAGGWVWPETWLAAFTKAGYRCWTLTLPGREGGASATRDPGAVDRALAHALRTGEVDQAADMLLRGLPGASLFDGPTLDDFSSALSQAMAQIGRPVVTVGHSLGGAVAQAQLRRAPGPVGTVLLASVPPYGIWRAGLEMAITNPSLWQTLAQFSVFGPMHADMNLMRQAFYPNGISDREYRAMVANLRDESLAASVQTLGFPPFAPLPGPRSDVLVIGGGADAVIPPLDVWLTAAYYGTRPVIVPGAGHMLMHEASAHQAVAAILEWCDGRATVQQAAA